MSRIDCNRNFAEQARLGIVMRLESTFPATLVAGIAGVSMIAFVADDWDEIDDGQVDCVT